MVFTMSLAELSAVLSADVAATGAAVNENSARLEVDRYAEGLISAWTNVTEDQARKGGTIAGSTLFGLFDSMGYLVTLAQSPKGTEAYTANMDIHFLRRGPVGRVLIEGRALRFGKRASVVAITVSTPALLDGPIASGTVTYAPVFPRD